VPGLKHIIQQHPFAIGITTAIISVVALGSVWFFVAQNKQEDVTNAAASERYAVQSVDLPVKSLSPSELSSVQSLSINGQLNVNNSLILSPSSRPSSPVKGQLYYDGTSNTIAYYDGTVFTSVADSVGQSVQDTRINQVEQEIVTLRNTAPAIPADIALLGSNNTFSGTNLFDGSITANGLYVNAAAQVAQNLLVGGSTTVSQSLTVNGAATLGATSISSLVLSTTLPVTSGGTGVGSFSANGVVIGNGTNPLGSVSAGAADLCFMSTSGAPEFKPCPGGVGSGVNSLNGLYGSLSIANATAAGSTITINNASTSAKGLAQFNATNFTVTGGVVNTAQNIATTATPTFSALQVTNNATIGGALTIGIACTPGQILTTNGSGTLVCVTDDTGTDTNTTYAAGSGITITGAANTISVNPQTGGGLSFTGGQLGLIGCTAGQILKYTGTAWGCAADADTISPGDGVGVTAVGTLNSQTKNSNGATIYNNGGTLTVALQSADASNPGLITTGAQTFSGAKVFSDDISLQGSIGQSGAGTFTTGTGAVALNGDVTIASGKSLTLGISCAANQVLTTNSSGVITCAADNTGTDTNTTYAAGDGISISGASNTIAVSPQTGGGLSFSSGRLGLIACTAGQILKYTGTAWGCATDSDTVSPGDGIGVTAVGTLDGQTKNSNGAAIYNNGGTLTIALQTADDTVAGLVSTGLQTFSGAKTFTSPLTVQNNFVQSGAATFTTGTGAVVLNGDVTIASGKGLTLGASCSSGQVLTTNGSGVVTCVTDNTGTDTNTTYAAGDGIAITGASNTISVNPQTGGGLEFAGGQLGLLACTTGQILKYDGADWVCATDSDTVSPGDGIGVTAVGALDGQTKNSNGATIYNNGGTLTIALQSADNLNSGLLTAGTQTIGGAKTFINDIALQGNFGQSGTGTFSTGTGAVALNGDVAIASGKSLTIGTACTAAQVLTTDTNGVITCATDNTGTDTNTTYAAGDGIAITGASNTISVNPQTGGGLSFVGSQLGITACSDGEILKYSSGAWGCAADSDTVSPGDGIGVTAVGTLDSQTKNSNGATIYNNGGTLTIALQSADGVNAGVVTAGSQTFGGAKTFSDTVAVQGAFTQTGTGTFSTGTGAVALNGNVTIASGSTLTIGTACTAGQVLTTDTSGVITCATDDTGTDTNTTYTAGDGITITGGANTISVQLQTGGGLGFVSGQLGLLNSCTDGQVLKANSGTWTCADDLDTNTGAPIASGSGTSGAVVKFNASGELADSGFAEVGTTATYSGNFIINGQTGFTGNLLDVQLNGASRLSVTESGSTTISGGLAVAGASGVTVGVVGSVQGSLKLATTDAGTLTIQSQPQAGNVTLSIPAITGNDTICLQTLANCGGEVGGVTTIGALDSQTKDANGATIVGTTLYLQTADTTSAGIISTGAQTIAGDKTFKSVANSQTAFRIQNATNDSVFVANTSANVITAGQANTAVDSFTKLADPSTLPPNSAQAVSYSNNGRYLVVAHQSSPYVTAYVRSGNSLTALSSSAFDILPSGTVYSIAFTQDDQYLALGAFSATSGINNLYVYKVQGDTFTKIADPSSLPAGNNVQGLSWSPDGTYLAVGTNSSDFLVVYKRSGDTLSALTLASLPSTPVRSIKFSPDGAYLAVGHNTNPYVTMYKRSGDTFTPLANPFSTSATGQVWGVDFSRDGTYFAAAHTTFPYLSIYKRSGDTFTKLANPATLPSSQGNAVHFSANGNYLAVAHNNSPYLSIYKRSGDTFTKLANPATLPAGNGSGAAFSPDGRYLSVASASSPYITTYDLTNGKNVDVKVNGSVIADRTSTTSLYVGNDTNLQGKITVGGGAQFNGTATFSNATTVAADFSIQNSAASTNILYANSSANTITIGQGYTDTLSLVSGVTALSGGSGTDTAFSRTGNYLAAINTSSPYIHTYKYNANGTFTKLANPDTLPGVSTGVALSSDATYMVVTQTAATRFAVYKRSGDTFAKLTNPTQPSGNAYAAAFSKDDAYLAIAHASSPYLSIYKRSGDTFTKLSDPASLPAGQGNSVAFSDNGDYLVVGHNSAPYITIYKRSGDTFTKLADPSTLPTSSVNGVAFSPDNGYMAVAYNSSPYVLIYKRSGDTFTKLADPSTLPASNANGVAFSADGTFLTVAHDSTPYITTYKRSGDTFTKLANPGTLPAGSANGVAYSGDGRYMSVSHGSGSLLTVYSLGKIDVATNIYGSLGVAGNASFTGLTVSGTSTFQDTISGTDAAFGAGVTIGTVGQSAGELTIASSGAGSVTLTTATQTDDYAITIPTLAGDDIVCLQNLGNCAGGSGGVNTSGTVTTGALTKFDGSGGITSSGLTESGTSLNYGGNIVANVDSGFSGHILDLQKAGSSVFKVGSSGLVTTAGGISGVAATGTNATGGNLTLQAGSGTGSAGSGVISFSTASQAQSPFIKDLTPAGQFYQSTSAAVSASFSQTVTSGSNQVLLVTMATGHGGVSATSVTYGGVALTKLAGVRQTYDASYTEMWYLVNPNVGSATVSVTLSTSATLYARAMVLTGVNQTTPFNTACTATASTTSITCSADTSGAGVVVSLLRASATYSSIGSGQVSVYGNDTPPAYTSVSAKATTTSSTSMSYTLSSGTYWGFVAVGVRLADTGVNPMGLTLVDTGTLEGGPLTERMRIASDGKVGIGTFNPQYQLDVAGDINTSTGFRVGGAAGVSLSCSGATQTLGNVTVTGGIITAASCATNSSDLAENYASTDNLTAGEIVMTSGVATSVNRATSAHRGDVIGVVSTAPGILIGTEQVPDGYPIALSGRVPVKVSNENGPIAVGDKITISSVAGVGMKATTSGMIVGTALEAFNGEEGTVEVFVNASYWAPSASETLQGATAEFTSLNVSGEATIATLSVGTVTVTGNITVHGLLTVANIVVNGHVITASGKPTVEAQAALNGGNVTVEGTDTVGTITITTGSTPTAGELAKIIFSQTYSKAPRVIVSPSNEAAADFAYYKGDVSLDDFMLNAKFAPAANTTYVFDYFIAE
jgi:WD40 repeat protein